MPLRVTVAVGVLLIAVAALYTTRLGDAPVYLMQDEVNFALQAEAIRSTGHDTNGRLLPVYFSETGFEAGRDPIIIYAQALMLRVLPLSESAVRLPTAILGVVNVLLMFLVGRRVFGRDRAGLLSAAMLAVTPAHFVNSRLAVSVIYPVPFILLWLLFLTHAAPPMAGPKSMAHRTALIGAGLSLGAGLFSYVASLVMTPVYVALSAWYLWRVREAKSIGLILAAFAVGVIPLVWWQAEHPDRYAALLNVYRPHDVLRLRERVSVLWSFFSPDYLFISGDSRITNSTRTAGMFPLACAVLMPIGVFQLARGRRGPIGLVILAGLITAPLASAVSGKLDINRVLFALPFGVLAAMAGVEYLLADRLVALRATALALLVAGALQFRGVYSDYMGPYRVLSAPWFGGNSRAMITEVLRHPEVGMTPVYLDLRTPIERYWRFYALAQGRPDLVEHPTYYDPLLFSGSSAAAGSLLVCPLTSGNCVLFTSQSPWDLVSTAIEPDGSPSFALYRRR